MNKPIISLGLWTLGLGSAAVVACSAPDPGVGYLGLSNSRGLGGNSATGSDDGGGGNGSSGGAGARRRSSGVSSSGSSGPGGEGLRVGGRRAADPPRLGRRWSDDAAGSRQARRSLGETTAYASAPGPRRRARTTAAGQAPQTPTTPACATCHGTGGAGSPSSPPASSRPRQAGRRAPSTSRSASTEQGPDAGYSGYTDSDGYFWINPPLGGVTGPYNAALRNATTTTPMPTHPNDPADCQSTTCHGGSQGNIHYP